MLIWRWSDLFRCFIFLKTMFILILQFQFHVSIMLELFEKYSSVSSTNILKISIYCKYVLKDIQPKDWKHKNLFLRKAAASVMWPTQTSANAYLIGVDSWRWWERCWFRI